MKSGCTNHPKFRALMRRLCAPQYAVVGVLESVWMLASQFADDGDLSRFTAEEIADYVAWEGDANELLQTLIECRWLDENEDQITVHDWAEHCPKYVADRLAKRKQRAQVSQNVGDSPRQIENVDENRGLPSQVKSNPTKSKCASRKRDAGVCEKFDHWWEHYPKKVDKARASKKFGTAVAKIRKSQSLDEPMAVDWLINRTKQYADSVAGTESRYIKGPASWLHEERYWDEAAPSTPDEVRDNFDPEVDSL